MEILLHPPAATSTFPRCLSASGPSQTAPSLSLQCMVCAKTEGSKVKSKNFPNVPSMRLLLEMPFVLLQRRCRCTSGKSQCHDLAHVFLNTATVSTIVKVESKKRKSELPPRAIQPRTATRSTYLQSAHGMVPSQLITPKHVWEGHTLTEMHCRR
jgi:hypothetical protein